MAGDLTAFELIVERYQQDVAKLALFTTNDPNIVEDVSQETFIKAFQYLESYDLCKSLRNWLLAIAANQSRTSLKKKKTTLPLQQLDMVANENIQEKVEGSMLLRKVLDCLAKAPFKQREVLVLHYIHELTLTEIQHLLRIPLGTVKSRLNRGLDRLRKELGEVSFEGEEGVEWKTKSLGS